MKTPLFSIIIPTYNSADTISKCLESIERQTCKDFEVLVMDGGSADQTSALVQQSAGAISELRFVSEQDKGIYDAMNKGIRLARGMYLLFLGSDDYLYDDAVLADVGNALKQTGADVLYGDANLLREGIRYCGRIDVLQLHTVQNLCHQTIFYRSDVFTRLGGFNLNYKIAADWDFNIRCFRHPELRIAYIDRVIVTFNNISGASSQPHQDPFYNEIPIKYIKEIKRLEFELDELHRSGAYRMGKHMFTFLEKIRMAGILRKLTSRRS